MSSPGATNSAAPLTEAHGVSEENPLGTTDVSYEPDHEEVYALLEDATIEYRKLEKQVQTIWSDLTVSVEQSRQTLDSSFEQFLASITEADTDEDLSVAAEEAILDFEALADELTEKTLEEIEGMTQDILSPDYPTYIDSLLAEVEGV